MDRSKVGRARSGKVLGVTTPHKKIATTTATVCAQSLETCVAHACTTLVRGCSVKSSSGCRWAEDGLRPEQVAPIRCAIHRRKDKRQTRACCSALPAPLEAREGWDAMPEAELAMFRVAVNSRQVPIAHTHTHVSAGCRPGACCWGAGRQPQTCKVHNGASLHRPLCLPIDQTPCPPGSATRRAVLSCSVLSPTSDPPNNQHAAVGSACRGHACAWARGGPFFLGGGGSAPARTHGIRHKVRTDAGGRAPMRDPGRFGELAVNGMHNTRIPWIGGRGLCFRRQHAC